LLPELGLTGEVAIRAETAKNPAEFAVLRHEGLDKEQGAARIYAAGKQVDHHLLRLLPELRRLERHGHGVQVDHGEVAAVAFLEPHPVADRPEVIAEVQLPRGLDARENNPFVHGCLFPAVPAGTALMRISSRFAAGA